jgi:hypothetical protein
MKTESEVLQNLADKKRVRHTVPEITQISVGHWADALVVYRSTTGSHMVITHYCDGTDDRSYFRNGRLAGMYAQSCSLLAISADVVHRGTVIEEWESGQKVYGD